jgi:hypothetical protein
MLDRTADDDLYKMATLNRHLCGQSLPNAFSCRYFNSPYLGFFGATSG